MQGVIEGQQGLCRRQPRGCRVPLPGSGAPAEHQSWCEVPGAERPAYVWGPDRVRVRPRAAAPCGADPLERPRSAESADRVEPGGRLPAAVRRAHRGPAADLGGDGATLQISAARRGGPYNFVAPTLRHYQEISTTVDTFYSVGSYGVINRDDDRTGFEMRLPPEVEPGSPFFLFSVYRDVATLAEFMDDLWQSPFPLDRLDFRCPRCPRSWTGS